MIWRSIISLSLALMLAVTSQAMAVTRGSAAASGQMVLCIGTGFVTVYTDADGAPTAAPHICPDCALNVVFVESGQKLTVPQHSITVVQPTVGQAQLLPAAKRVGALSRAPPSLI